MAQRQTATRRPIRHMAVKADENVPLPVPSAATNKMGMVRTAKAAVSALANGAAKATERGTKRQALSDVGHIDKKIAAPPVDVSRLKLASSSETKPRAASSRRLPQSNSHKKLGAVLEDLPKEALAAAAFAAEQLSSEAERETVVKSKSVQSQLADEREREHDEDEEEEDDDEDDWLRLSPGRGKVAAQIMGKVNAEFQEELDFTDTTMLAEYQEEILGYMAQLECTTMPTPNYMDSQTEIKWDMRATLVDWLMQLHLRYHLLPETMWIAVNILDRFLSVRIVSLVKLQLVGVTAMFIAAKYEEILAPSVDEFVFMTENGFSKEEILKGERIMLQTLSYEVSPYCNPFTWVRRISKADDYDIQTRTLCKFIIEVTLLDHRFLRVKPSQIAAVGMYLSRKMLGGDWDDAFKFYSGHCELELDLAAEYIMDSIIDLTFESQFVFKKYSSKRFLKASSFARDWTKVQRKQRLHSSS